jgi:hypothetical protein
MSWPSLSWLQSPYLLVALGGAIGSAAPVRSWPSDCYVVRKRHIALGDDHREPPGFLCAGMRRRGVFCQSPGAPSRTVTRRRAVRRLHNVLDPGDGAS